jgi:hypothetical protein
VARDGGIVHATVYSWVSEMGEADNYLEDNQLQTQSGFINIFNTSFISTASSTTNSYL